MPPVTKTTTHQFAIVEYLRGIWQERCLERTYPKNEIPSFLQSSLTVSRLWHDDDNNAIFGDIVTDFHKTQDVSSRTVISTAQLATRKPLYKTPQSSFEAWRWIFGEFYTTQGKQRWNFLQLEATDSRPPNIALPRAQERAG